MPVAGTVAGHALRCTAYHDHHHHAHAGMRKADAPALARSSSPAAGDGAGSRSLYGRESRGRRVCDSCARGLLVEPPLDPKRRSRHGRWAAIEAGRRLPAGVEGSFPPRLVAEERVRASRLLMWPSARPRRRTGPAAPTTHHPASPCRVLQAFNSCEQLGVDKPLPRHSSGRSLGSARCRGARGVHMDLSFACSPPGAAGTRTTLPTD